jgi:hypothetical protein
MSTVKLVTVFAENKTGQIARMTQTLADHRVNIRWVNIATSGSFGVVRFLVDKVEEANQVLRATGFTVSLLEVLAIEVTDEPGGLATVCQRLAENKINVENASGFVSNHRAVLLLELHDVAQAQKALGGKNLKLLSAEDVLVL